MPEAENAVAVQSPPAMNAELETVLLEDTRPIRISGFFALGFGLLSFLALLGTPMLIVPVLATLFALVALRPYSGERPVGYTLATVGLFAAILFGVWGLTQRHFRAQVMSQQAVQFASNWLDLLAQGDVELAVELQTHPSRRQSETMPLDEYYSNSEDGKRAMAEFRESPQVQEVLRAGPQVRWETYRQPVVYTLYGREMVSTIWQDQSGTVTEPIKVNLEYLPASGSEPAQWRVDALSLYVEESPGRNR